MRGQRLLTLPQIRSSIWRKNFKSIRCVWVLQRAGAPHVFSTRGMSSFDSSLWPLKTIFQPPGPDGGRDFMFMWLPYKPKKKWPTYKCADKCSFVPYPPKQDFLFRTLKSAETRISLFRTPMNSRKSFACLTVLWGLNQRQKQLDATDWTVLFEVWSMQYNTSHHTHQQSRRCIFCILEITFAYFAYRAYYFAYFAYCMQYWAKSWNLHIDSIFYIFSRILFCIFCILIWIAYCAYFTY